MAEEEKIKQFEKEQLEILLNDLQDINKFTGFRDGSFKFELGKYQANLLVNCIKGYKEVIDKADKWVRNYMDEWDIYDEVWHDLNDLLILLEEVK